MRWRTAAAALVLCAGCSSNAPDIATLSSNSDQVIWDAGQKAFEKHQWDNARQHYKRIIEGFPQSQLGPAARIGMADSYFNEGGTANFILAVSAYREFLTYYPSHPRSDYAQYQVGESFYRQKNGPDRDQSATEEALAEFQRLLDQYPESPRVEDARKRVQELRQTLARAEYLAGYFYQRTRQACRAAILRYEGILTEFPDYQHLDEVLFRLSECLCQTGRGVEAQPLLARLQSEFPTSEHAEEARKFQCETPLAPVASPSPSPSPSPSATPTPAPAGS